MARKKPVGTVGSSIPYLTFSSSIGTTPIITSNSSINSPPSLSVKGNADFEGDITIKGQSLNRTLEDIQKRLAILVPDPAKLEQFEALKKAYEQYKILEALCHSHKGE